MGGWEGNSNADSCTLKKIIRDAQFYVKKIENEMKITIS